MFLHAVKRLQSQAPTMPTAWLMGACMEAKGKQELWTMRKPEVLAALREQAVIQSAESSNRMEGVTVAPGRLRPILLGKSKPRDRSEEELVGYRKALQWIHTRNPEPLEPGVILRLHALSQGGFAGDAGKWKKRDNEIIEYGERGEPVVRFKPTSAKATPDAVHTLCIVYRDFCDKERLPPLLAITTFVFDFLCVHPFRDGNGRVSRLLTTLLLQQHGFEVVRYLSLERLIEESKADYYEVLKRCSKGWHDGKNEIVPWWNYMLGILKNAYGEFSSRVERFGAIGKADLVRTAVLRQEAAFTVSTIATACPSVSVPYIRKVLKQMRSKGEVAVQGYGRGAKWTLLA
ncbi:MAG: Fic family protein [Planctomycetota bacterium]|nr:Fic family protein [Planctomycetota bacterium]